MSLLWPAFSTADKVSSATGVINVLAIPCCCWFVVFLLLLASLLLLVYTVAGDSVIAVAVLLL